MVAEVIIACNSTQKIILEKELPSAGFVELEGYAIVYNAGATTTKLKLLLQLRNILMKIKRENRWLKTFLEQNPVDALISDNRYGFFSSKIPSVFITHQLRVKTGFGKFADILIQKFLYKWINRFTECWVPDFESGNGIAGALSHPARFPSIPVKYLGGLSRFETCPSSVIKYDILILISGPEPQRTIFENIVLKQAGAINKRIVVVKGITF